MAEPPGTEFPKDVFRTPVAEPPGTEFPKDMSQSPLKEHHTTNDGVLIGLFWGRPRPYNEPFFRLFGENFLKYFAPGR